MQVKSGCFLPSAENEHCQLLSRFNEGLLKNFQTLDSCCIVGDNKLANCPGCTRPWPCDSWLQRPHDPECRVGKQNLVNPSWVAVCQSVNCLPVLSIKMQMTETGAALEFLLRQYSTCQKILVKRRKDNWKLDWCWYQKRIETSFIVHCFSSLWSPPRFCLRSTFFYFFKMSYIVTSTRLKPALVINTFLLLLDNAAGKKAFFTILYLKQRNKN